jgi:hypothetical protein
LNREFGTEERTMNNPYDSSWDDEDGNAEAWERKRAEWEKRDWPQWLKSNLSFPFRVMREEDQDSFFDEDAKHKPFAVGHTMDVLGMELEDDMYGIIIKVREGKRVGHVPLCDVEVMPKTDKNFWPVREYVVWFANR